MAKYVFVTGGVLSSLGKGITASSIGAIFKAQGYNVIIKKFDPYFNYNPGMMSPLQHGEVFVTEDGAEGDLDLGHYERFTNANTNRHCDVTSGQIYYSVIERERMGGFHGETVQVIPHITDRIKECATVSDDEYDIILIEIGGTVGDIEGQPYLEAIRQLRFDLGDADVAYIHVTPLIYVKTAGELKTKPTQHSVQKLREIGITPDLLICRTEYDISEELKKKLALFCNIRKEAVISAVDASPLYKVILNLYKQDVGKIILNKFMLQNKTPDLSPWEKLINKLESLKEEVVVGVVGKYINMKDAYISLDAALAHGGVANDVKVNIRWIDAEDLEKNNNFSEELSMLDGILVPGGFGVRGMEGKIISAKFARENNVPFLGTGGLGFQCAILDGLNCSKADSYFYLQEEVQNNEENQNSAFMYIYDKDLGEEKQGRMKLGAHKTNIQSNSLAHKIYEKNSISERHRHRFELNKKFIPKILDRGFVISGYAENTGFADIIEYPLNDWFMAVQFIPEYKSRPLEPHPIFVSFIKSVALFKGRKA